MRILLDHNVPVPPRHFLIGHEVETAYERGWAELTNGELLRAAEEAGFDAFLTTDQGIRYQQNLRERRLALVVLSTNDWTRIRGSTGAVVDAITRVVTGTVVEVEIPQE